MLERTEAVSLKLESAAMICLMLATSLSFAATQNQTLLNAYSRHGVEMFNDLTTAVANPNWTGQQKASEHLIRAGRHVGLLNENVDKIEQSILANQTKFVYGDWSKAVSDLQAKLNAMGFKGKIASPSPAARARLLAAIQQHGLKQHLHILGAASELKGSALVSPYAEHWRVPTLMNVTQLVWVNRDLCGYWIDGGNDLMAIALAGSILGLPEFGAAVGLYGAGLYLWGRFAPEGWC